MPTKNATDFSDLPDNVLDLVADCFQALSDPTRLKILRALKSGEKTVQELVAMFDWTQPNISRHLSILARAGMVNKTKEGPFVYYGIANPRVFTLCDNVCSHVNGVIAAYGKTARRR
ncbi:MAG: metalloregulator ArsR/SmtB family transcription factor [candidate division Zixibacteria bacterium]|nr:metalloregulator ArsR/SmtB family transcription factor [candidate division Zixibacteria bacterium]